MAGVGSYYEILGRLGTGNSHSRETRKSQASKEVTGDDGPVLGVLPRAALAATLRRKVTSNTGARRGTAGPKMEPGGDSLLGGMAGRKVRIGAVFQAARSMALEQALRIGAGSEAMDLAVARAGSADDGERASTVKVAGEVTEKKHAGKVSSTYPPDL